MEDLAPVEWLDAERLATSIQRMPPKAFADLCNDLLIETASVAGAPPGCMRTSLEVFEPDEGLDATCIEAHIVVPPWIPDATLVGYQFRSGRSRKSAKAILKNDIESKEGVKAVLDEGGSFVFISAWDRRSGFEGELREEVTKSAPKLHPDRLHYIGGDLLARQVTRLPGLLCRLVDIGGLMDFDEWQRLPPLKNPFLMDESVRSLIAELRKRVTADGARLRVTGRPGDGKTRTVREVLEGSGLGPSTVYAGHVDDVPSRFLSYLRRAQPLKCTLAVDEADPATMEDLEQQLSVARSQQVRLVVIGHTELGRQPGPGADVYQLAPLDEELLKEIVTAAAPGVPEEVAKDIARVCSGSPKLALLLANRVGMNPELASRQHLLADRETQDALDRFLNIDLTNDSWRAAAAVALVDHVGWLGGLSHESEALFEAVRLDPMPARHAVEDFDRQFGILPLAGRLRYISPVILGDHLAAKQIRGWSEEQLRTFVEALTPRLAAGFATRVRQLGRALEANRGIVQQLILGDASPFRSIDDLERGGSSRVIRLLAGPFRHATLRLLRRIVEPATSDELREATKSRRDLVNALEELLWFEDTFEGAALLLHRLAVAENERWANNATALWQETFQPVLGRTAAGPARRLRAVKRASESEAATGRGLAAMAIKAGLRLGQTHRAGMPPRDVEDAPEEAWRPKTWGELADLVLGYLDLLAELLTDEDVEVREKAVEALAEGTYAARILPRVFARWTELARGLTGAAFGLRASLVRELALEVRRARSQREESPADLAETELAEFEGRLQELADIATALEGTDFTSRFRRGLTLQPFEADDSYEEASERVKRGLKELATEVLEDPELLEGQWSWLLDEQPSHAGAWLYELGQQDCERTIAHRVAEVALRHPETGSWLSIYDLGFMHGCADGSYAATRVGQLREEGSPPEQRLDFLVRAGYTAERFEQLLQMFDSGELPPSAVARLKYGGWTDKIGVDDAARLLQQTIGESEACVHLITFLYDLLRGRPADRERFRDQALELLMCPGAGEAGVMFDYEWTELAGFYLPDAALPVAQAAIRRIADREVAYDDRLNALVRKAWAAGPRERILREALSEGLERDSVGAWWVRKALSPFPLWELDTADVIEWLEEDVQNRVGTTAELIGAPSGERPSELHAVLLERFGEYDVGDVFYTDLVSGSWTGSAARRTRGLITQAEGWLEDDRPAVEEWARESIKRLNEMLTHDVQREAEEELRW